jgi:pimeloyl-ACP methyl ester carboxylesterase
MVAAARTFARHGMTAATFDYRGFGASGGTPRQVVSVPRQLADVRATLTYVRNLDGVDPARVGLWGTSLGGGHVLSVAAEDPAVAAVVAQAPFNGFPRKSAGRSTVQAVGLLWTALKDRLRGRTGHQPLYVKAVGTAEEQAVMVGGAALSVVAELESRTWRNEVAPRALLEMMHYRPGRTVHRIKAPLLISIGSHDEETVESTTRHLAALAPRGTLHTYPISHFDFYRPDVRRQVLADQSEFLREAFDLPTGS